MSEKQILVKWDEVLKRLKPIDKRNNIVFGITKDGKIASSFLSKAKVTYDPKEATIFLDCVRNSGRMIMKWKKDFADTKFHVLIDTTKEVNYDGWIVFPWELDDQDEMDNALWLLGFFNKLQSTINTKKIFNFIKTLN